MPALLPSLPSSLLLEIRIRVAPIPACMEGIKCAYSSVVMITPHTEHVCCYDTDDYLADDDEYLDDAIDRALDEDYDW